MAQPTNASTPVTVPELRKEHLDMIPNFNGEPSALPRFIEISEKLVIRFFNIHNVNDFQNEFLMSSIRSKIVGQAAEVINNAYVNSWEELKSALLTAYSDRRDCYTLNNEIATLKQLPNESPFTFYERLNKLLNLQLAYFNNNMEHAQTIILGDFARKCALRTFLCGLRDPLKSLMQTKNPESLCAALGMLTNDFQLKRVEQIQNFKFSQSPPAKNQNFSQHRQPNFYRPLRPTFNNPPFNPPQNAIVPYRPPLRPQFPNRPNFYHQTNSRPNQPIPMSISTNNTRRDIPNNNQNRNAMYNIECHDNQVVESPAENENKTSEDNFLS